MTDKPEWTTADQSQHSFLRFEAERCKTPCTVCALSIVVGLILTAAQPLLGVFVMAGGYFGHLYFASRQAKIRDQIRQLLESKGLDPRNYGYDEHGRYND